MSITERERIARRFLRDEIRAINEQIETLGGCFTDEGMIHATAWPAIIHKAFLRYAFIHGSSRLTPPRALLGLYSFRGRAGPNEYGLCYPKSETLARRIGRSKTATLTALDHLEAAGIIQIKKNRDPVTQERRSSNYRFDRSLLKHMRMGGKAGVGGWWPSDLSVLALVLEAIKVKHGYAQFVTPHEFDAVGMVDRRQALDGLRRLMAPPFGILARVGDGRVTLRMLLEGEALKEAPSERFWDAATVD